MKTLVTYFSRTGHTRGVAEKIASRVRGTAMPITESRSRLGLLGYQRSLVEAVFGLDATIEPPPLDARAFDLVVIGTPIWGWHLSSPVRAYARGHAKAIGHAAFFCTMGGSGSRQAFDELEQLIGRRPLATLALTERELADRSLAAATAAKIESFAAALHP